jgi:hypothetical protein
MRRVTPLLSQFPRPRGTPRRFHHASISSLVALEVPPQYDVLPLTLLPSPTSSSEPNTDTIRITPVTQLQLPHIGHSAVTPRPSLTLLDWQTTPTQPVQHLSQPSSTVLESETQEENPLPPRPEKPRWEEEQYPDIGKSSVINSMADNSNRHCI